MQAKFTYPAMAKNKKAAVWLMPDGNHRFAEHFDEHNRANFDAGKDWDSIPFPDVLQSSQTTYEQ
ncbi:MAG TPA: hypothetical protein VLX29_04645 [Nitrospirota bacterium]|nr:hypothetical protein [Nitrospirota bacterium]